MRATNNSASRARRKKVKKIAKGFWGARSKHYRRIRENVRRALAYAYRDRRTKKREFRSLWIKRINAACRQRGTSYRLFISALKKNNIILSRNILAKLAAEEPDAFDELVNLAKK
jgi:large subunit ribosomal protein L20